MRREPEVSYVAFIRRCPGEPRRPTMPGQQREAVPGLAAIERLSTAFNRCFETRDAGEDVFAHDAFFDLYPPFWRFQLQGREAFAAQLRAVGGGDATTRILRVVPTATGFVMEHEETQRGATVEVARHLSLCEVRDGLITEVVSYCNGDWDDDLRARHAAEAPMLRP
jgi:hypothetical protein